MLQIMNRLKQAYLTPLDVSEEKAVEMIRSGYTPFSVVASTPAGGRETFNILAKHSADAGLRALELLFPDDSVSMPRGMTLQIKTTYVR